MADKQVIPREKIAFRVKPAEYLKIHGFWSRTTCRNISEYVRDVCLRKPIVINYRNQTAEDCLQEFIVLRNDLTRAADAVSSGGHAALQTLLDKVEEIRVRMNQIYAQWSQK